MSSRKFVGSVKQALELLNQNRIAHRLHCAALEALYFHHPYKNFVIEMGVRDNVTTNLPELGGVNVYVHDFIAEVARFSLFEPEGETRDKTQLDIRYNYNVHTKQPRNVKRTSNLNKIDGLVKMIKPAEPVDILRNCPNPEDLIDKASNYRQANRAFRKVFDDLYYKDKDQSEQLIDDLLNKRDTLMVTELRTKFDTARSEKAKAQEEHTALSEHIVSVVKNSVHDNYCVVRYNFPNEPKMQILSVNVYDSKEHLPDDVLGHMAVLEIGLADSTQSLVEGLGQAHHHALGDSYTLIGKEFNGNAGTEGESQSI